MKIVWIGAGNLATRVAFAMSEAGLTIVQVYSHTLPHAEALAGLLGCEATNNLAEVRTDAASDASPKRSP